MKKIILSVLVVLMGLSSLVAQNKQSKKDAVGTWKFEAPNAPEGYKSGIIVVGLEEQKYSTTMSFTGSEYKIPGEKVKALNDSILRLPRRTGYKSPFENRR